MARMRQIFSSLLFLFCIFGFSFSVSAEPPASEGNTSSQPPVFYYGKDASGKDIDPSDVDAIRKNLEDPSFYDQATYKFLLDTLAKSDEEFLKGFDKYKAHLVNLLAGLIDDPNLSEDVKFKRQRDAIRLLNAGIARLENIKIKQFSDEDSSKLREQLAQANKELKKQADLMEQQLEIEGKAKDAGKNAERDEARKKIDATHDAVEQTKEKIKHIQEKLKAWTDIESKQKDFNALLGRMFDVLLGKYVPHNLFIPIGNTRGMNAENTDNMLQSIPDSIKRAVDGVQDSSILNLAGSVSGDLYAYFARLRKELSNWERHLKDQPNKRPHLFIWIDSHGCTKDGQQTYPFDDKLVTLDKIAETLHKQFQGYEITIVSNSCRGYYNEKEKDKTYTPVQYPGIRILYGVQRYETIKGNKLVDAFKKLSETLPYTSGKKYKDKNKLLEDLLKIANEGKTPGDKGTAEIEQGAPIVVTTSNANQVTITTKSVVQSNETFPVTLSRAPKLGTTISFVSFGGKPAAFTQLNGNTFTVTTPSGLADGNHALQIGFEYCPVEPIEQRKPDIQLQQGIRY